MTPVIPNLLYRAARPGYSGGANTLVGMGDVQSWLDAAQAAGIASIICLLDEEHLCLYPDGDLLGIYRTAGFELHHLVKTKVPKLVVTHVGALTDQREQKFLRQVESYVDGVEREDFVPAPSLACASCEYFSECSLWPEVRK